MTFWKTVGAYLTGWLIARATFERALRAWRRIHLRDPTEEDKAYFGLVAVAVADEIEGRELSDMLHAGSPYS